MTSGKEQQERAQYERYVRRLGYLVMAMDAWVGVPSGDGSRITELRLRAARAPGEDCLVIVKMLSDGRRWVAFHGAENPSDALRGALERLKNDQLQWKQDKYAQGSNGVATAPPEPVGG